MKLSNTTLNFAKKRGLYLELVESDEYIETPRLWIYTDFDACEPDLSYFANDNGSFSFKENLSLPQEIKEELPATIKDEKALRMMLAFIAEELKSK